MGFLQWPVKDSNEVLDYVLDWSARLDTGDAIASSTWIVPSGITKDSDNFGGSTTTIWLSGGTDGETYTFTNRITTDDGRTMDQSVRLRLKIK